MSIPLLAAGRTVTDLNTEVTEDTEITEPALGSSSPCTLWWSLCALCRSIRDRAAFVFRDLRHLLIKCKVG